MTWNKFRDRVTMTLARTIGVVGLATGCTDAGISKLTNYGTSARIACYSGGLLIYEGESTGKVSSEVNSDGYFFKEKGTGKLLEVSGNCIITYNQ